MFSSLIPTGVTSLFVDLTSGYAPLVVGLVGLTWISAGMITWIALAHYWETSHLPMPEQPSSEPVAAPLEYKEAA
jgi:hypothetical protein